MRKSIILLCLVLAWGTAPRAQVSSDTAKPTFPGKEEYFIDPATQKLAIDVHIWGEVTIPGVYRVPLGTNVLELISLAHGPTEYSNLSRIKLTHWGPNGTPRVETVNLPHYLSSKGGPSIPILGPGDVVTVPRNIRHAWENSIKLVGDIVTVVSLIFLISQIQKK